MSVKTGQAQLIGSSHGQNFSFRVADLEPYQEYTFGVAARDDENNQTASRIETTIKLTMPDPSDVAPRDEPLVPQSNFDRNTYLFEGDDPIQRDVEPGTIEERRISVFRGRVLDREGDPVEGVHISIHRHPEYGYTLTRTDGRFDLAINGGAPRTIVYKHGGYLTSHRTLPTDWQKNEFVPEVVLVQKDVKVNPVDLSQDIQVASGSEITDERGTRTGTAIFRQGTVANMVLPDGSRQELETFNVRFTEFTSGDSGLEAMPAALPPTTAFTFAGEFTVDEAEAAGATRVEFSRPAAFYVDDFRSIPVGKGVPLGYYDRERALWVPEENGLVIEILGADQDGLAEIDVEGDGSPAGSDTLSALDFTEPELRKLADIYQPGDVLWRSLLPHFSAWDANWGVGCDDSAACTGPKIQSHLQGQDTDPDCTTGSIIGCQSQTLSESVPVAGTAFALVYDSERQVGYAAKRTGRLRLFEADSKPAGLLDQHVALKLAGRCIDVEQVDGQPGLYEYDWDGISAYDRRISGSVAGTLGLSFYYPLTYQSGSFASIPGGVTVGVTRAQDAESPTCFGSDSTFSGSGLASSGSAGMFGMSVGVPIFVDAWSTPQRLLGGWSLNVHHAFDPTTENLYLGSGLERHATEFTESVQTIAGGGDQQLASVADEMPATDVRLYQPKGMDVGADGAVYFADASADAVFRIDVDGTLHVVAGVPGNMGSNGFAGDGGLAVYARLDRPSDVAIAPDGSIYILDMGNQRIRRVDRNGIINTVAGSHVHFQGEFGDDHRKPALEAKFSFSIWSGLDVGPDGAVYIADTNNHRIRRLGPDGMIETVAGSSEPNSNGNIQGGYVGNGGRARRAELDTPAHVAVATDGSVYFADRGNDRIRRISNTGFITTVAGNGGSPQPYTEGTATEIGLNSPSAIAVDSSGAVIFSDTGHNSGTILRKLDNGKLRRIAGSGNWRHNGDEVEALQANISSRVLGLSARPDGTVVFSDENHKRVQHLWRVSQQLESRERMIASRDGAQLYIFDEDGRHLRTLHALTGAKLLDFEYDNAGLLVEITDGDGLTARIERDASGQSESIVGPYGHTTTFTSHQGGEREGFLETVTLPDGATYEFDYFDPDNPEDDHCEEAGSNCTGLLKKFVEPEGGVHRYKYDATGRLTSDEGPEGFEKTLERSFSANGVDYAVDVTTRKTSDGNGNKTYTQTYSHTSTDDGPERAITHPSGHQTLRSGRKNMEQSVTGPDGTQQTTKFSADPRFRRQAPVMDSFTLTTPSGRSFTLATEREVTLSDDSDLLSLETLTSKVTTGQHTFTSVFDSATRTFTSTSPEGRTSTVTVDELGRAVEAETPGLHPISYTYDDDGRIESVTRAAPDGSESRTTAYEYFSLEDAQDTDLRAGNLKSVTGPDGVSTSFDYDIPGRTSWQTLPSTPGATDSADRTIFSTFDANGNLDALQPPARAEHTFDHDLANRAQNYTPPVTSDPIDASIDYTYNNAHMPTSVSRAIGDVDLVYEDTTDRLDYIDTPGERRDYLYADATGQLDRVERREENSNELVNAVEFVRDGELLESTTWLDSSDRVIASVGRSYDDQFRVSSRNIDGSHSVAFDYWPDGMVKSAGPLTLDYYDTHGLLDTVSIGSTTTSYSYTGFGEIENYAVADAAGSLFEVDYTYDDFGRIDTLTEGVDGATRSYQYIYDDRGRLEEVLERDGQSGAYDTIEVYEYDGNGNRTAAENAFHTLSSSDIEVDAQDRLTHYGVLEFTYTDSGELLTKTDTQSGASTSFDYDIFSNLRGVDLPDGRAIEYEVDALDRRIARRMLDPQGAVVDEQRWVYKDQINPIAEFDGDGNLTKRFVYASKPHVPDYMIEVDPQTGDETTYRIVSDHVGSVRLVVDVDTGTIAQKMRYDAWGNVLEDTNEGFQPFGYAGGLYDAETELVRFGARDYDSRIGRWTTKDPIGFGGEDGNLYGYVRASPVSLVDPTGAVPIAVPIVIGALVSGAADAGIQYAVKGSIDHGQVAISTVAGGIGGAATWAARGAIAAKNLVYARSATVAADAGIGAVTGGGAQMSANAYHGNDLSDGVGLACALGGGLGAAGGYASSKVPSYSDIQFRWWEHAHRNADNLETLRSPSLYSKIGTAAEYSAIGLRSTAKQGSRPFGEQ